MRLPFAGMTIRITTGAAALLLAGALFLTACGNGEETGFPPPSTSVPAGTAAAAPAAAANPTTAAGVGAPATADAGAAGSAGSAGSDDKVSVVVGNAILADLARQVGGDRVSVFNLVPTGSDVHTWQSTPQDSVRIAEANVIISNGAGLSRAVESLIENVAAPDAVQVVASAGLPAQELATLPFPGHDADGHDGHDDHAADGHDDHGGDDHGDDHDEEAVAGRLLVGDGESGQMSVIDLESGAVMQDAFDMGARAGRIYATGSGRYAIAVASDANTAHIFDGGIYREEHGDHPELVENDVRRLNIDLSGDRPVHLYVGEEWSTIYYDGSGDVALVSEHELEHDGDSYVPGKFNAGPHHGAAVPLEGDVFAVTVQHPDYASNPEEYRLPESVAIRDEAGMTLYTAAAKCPDLHGDAGNGHMAVFGCTGGAMMVEAHDGAYADAFIPAPAGAADDFRLTSVWGYHGLDHFFALGSGVGLYLVEPEMGTMEQVIPATEALRPIQVALSYDGELLLVVMSDGEVRMYDAHDADMLASVTGILSDAIDPGFWARPHIATAPGRIFITDSGAGEVIALDAHDLEVVRHFDVSGKPTKIAFVGVLAETHGVDDDHDADGDDHGDDDHGDDDHGDDDHGDDDHGDDDHEDEHGHDHSAGDPHFWLNPRLVVHYVNQITNGLVAADPTNAAVYLDNATAYITRLDELDAYIADAVAGIPAERRVLVTFHDAFGYFGARYDLEVFAFVGGHGGDVSPDDIVRVLDLVQDQGLLAVFAEQQFSDDALQQVARDTGVSVGIIRSMPDAEHTDYIGLMRANADALAALAP